MIRVDQELCNGCGFCVRSCPVSAISMVSRMAYVDTVKCIECENCCSVCPRSAIKSIEVPSLNTLKAQANHLSKEIKALLLRIERMAAKG
jgi:Fe-S-cluster-containing hydrogenase component 2